MFCNKKFQKFFSIFFSIVDVWSPHEDPMYTTGVSSAKLCIAPDKANMSISLLYKLNNNAPSTLRWGIPYLSIFFCYFLFICLNYLFSLFEFLKKVRGNPRILTSPRTQSKWVWFIVANAFPTTRNTSAVSSLLSIEL